MCEQIAGVTRGGTIWIPAFVVDIDQGRCIGCGRCFKVCPSKVFELIEREDGEEFEDDEWADDEVNGFADDTAMVMSIRDLLDCIGCEACARVCPKDCLIHAPRPVANADVA